MKILMILSKEFLVDPRVNKEATSLVQAGHEVTVLQWDRPGTYDHDVTYQGIRVIRIRHTALMKLLPNDLFRNPFWWRAAYRKALQLFHNGYRFNVVHCHDLDTLQTGVWLKKKLNVKLVYDAHEIFGSMISRDVPALAVTAAFFMEKRLIRHVDHTITVNTLLKNYLQTISKQPITIVMNTTEITTTHYAPPNNKIFTLSYMGDLSEARMFPDLIDIVGTIENVQFLIAGKKENLYEEVKTRSMHSKNIEFLGTIDIKEAMRKTMESDAVICVFDPTNPNNKVGLPNKLFESMATGRPIIVTKGLYYSSIVEQEYCGLLVEYTKESVRDAIIRLRDDPQLCETLGKNGLKAAQETYNWNQQKIHLLQVYEGFQ